jgi:hypothetical protein
MAGLTFDTGALIGLERRGARIRRVFTAGRRPRAARRRGDGCGARRDGVRLRAHFRSVRVLRC